MLMTNDVCMSYMNLEGKKKKKNSGSGVLFLKLGDDFGCSLKPLNESTEIN